MDQQHGQNPSDRVAQLGLDYRQALIENMARLVGDRPMRGAKISHQRELELWMLPTSPAAIEAFKRGASLPEAEQANAMWAQQMVAEREAMLQQQAPPEQIEQAGLTDAAIFETCRKFAVQRGRFHGHDDPEKEAAYHEKMAARASAFRAGETMSEPSDGGEGASDGSTN